MTKAERAHLNKLAEMGCIICRRLGFPGTPAQIHHPRKGQGMAQRAPHEMGIPLCWEHHLGKTGIHGMGTKAFERHYGVTELELLQQTMELNG